MSGMQTTGTFIWNFLRNPKRNASLIPSSRRASKAMFQGIKIEKMSYIVELGPGTGCFTQELYANVSRDCKVLIIELNTAYIQFLRDKYGDRFEIIQGSAADLDALIEERDWPRVDLIVSGLPFTLPSEVMQAVMKSLQKRTESGTIYRWFTYFPWIMERYYARFTIRQVQSVFLNFPPMWIYTVN